CLLVAIAVSGCRSKPVPSISPPSASATASAAFAPRGDGSAIPAAVSPKSAEAPTQPAARCPTGMLEVPGGKFWVGSEPDDGFAGDESPRFLTELPKLCMDETEVTVAAYATCVERGTCKAPARQGFLCNFGRAARTEHPINCVTWADADGYCRARGARLPSEVELEYVARGGAAYLEYPWGDDAPDGHTCWKRGGTCAVKSFPAGAFGLYDVSGNVWEWGADWYGAYPWPPETGYSRVYRGGSFSRRFDKWMHTRLRNRQAPDAAGAHLGFRCALTLGSCPFGEEQPGRCRHGVLERACPKDKTFNGARCVLSGEPRCRDGWVERPGHGCVLATPEDPEVEDLQASAKNVTRSRSPEFDADCRHNSRDRPNAFRYVGGSHAARNLVSRRSGCKNRDVGVGWNSTCCP
ncbi:MAG TPA: SUMF1/EgtB/PvdO family nonheme iron enzyme, partial [Polyangiaceae bacterium]|nr:SUMF1/EgtB/PvdO family nonheme iron enzyme [Polyangiaceae bacterium]